MAVGHAGLEMDARFDDRIAAPLRRQARLDRGQDFLVGDLELLDIEAVQIGDIDRRHGGGSREGDSGICLDIKGPAEAVNAHGVKRPMLLSGALLQPGDLRLSQCPRSPWRGAGTTSRTALTLTRRAKHWQDAMVAAIAA